MSEVALHKEFIAVNGVKLHVVSAGPADGEPILMLHGFPEFWYGWRHQIDFLAQQGYRVIAPDQRGYNLSDKPRSASDYRISTLAQDIDALIGALGYEQVNLVGHDWGGAVAWWVATMFPQRLKKLIILNIPYPSVMKRAFQSGNFAQLRKSWYMFAFQVPWLPEALAAINDYRGVAKSIAGTGKPGTFSEADLDLYRAPWSANLPARAANPVSACASPCPHCSSGANRIASWARNWRSPASTFAMTDASSSCRRPPTGCSTMKPPK